MANKPITDSWPLIPTYWQTEVPRLLNSKGDFLGDKKRSSAAVAGLATLYEELETAWDALTLRPSKARLALLRQRARRLQQDLSRSETSVTSDLETQYERELQNAEKRMQTRSENLQSRKLLLAKKKTSWPAELAQMRNECASSLRTLRGESNERKKQMKANTLEKWTQFNSNASGDETSLAELDEKQQLLLKQQQDLAQLEQSLKNRKASLPEQQQQIDADLLAQQQTSEKSSRLRIELKSKQQNYVELKAKVLSLGLIKVEDFPDQ